jgi:acid phosphatase
VVVLVFISAFAGCGGGSSPPFGGGPGPGGGSVPSSHHIVMVMEENQAFETVAGDTVLWPNLNKLIAQGALPTQYYANTHPSIGNYFMLTTGQTLTVDDNSTKVWNVDNIARHMISAGVSFRIYAEGATQGYVGGNTGLYLIRHNPFAMLSDVAGNPQTASKYLWPFSQFAADAAGNALPQFSFIIPNIADDAHSGLPMQADSWLQSRVVVPISATFAFKGGGDGILIVAFDESLTADTTNGGGHVAPVLWGPIVKPGYTQSSKTVYQHQSMLATIMAALDLSGPPGAAANAPLMGEFFVQK